MPLWHVKWSFDVSSVMAVMFAKKYKTFVESLDCVVVSVGSGATLVFAWTLKQFNSNIKLIVAEHETAKLFANGSDSNMYLPGIEPSVHHELNFIEVPDSRIPNLVLGPHFESINCKLPNHIRNGLDGVAIYNDEHWMSVSSKYIQNGVGVGNSSAASIAVAEYISQQYSFNVTTFVYEPFRSYMLRRD